LEYFFFKKFAVVVVIISFVNHIIFSLFIPKYLVLLIYKDKIEFQYRKIKIEMAIGIV